MVPTGRQWWSVAGWLAFAVALGLECVALLRGDALGDAAGWTTLALYVFWMASEFLSGRVRRLQERMEDREVTTPVWMRWLAILLSIAVLMLILTNLEHLYKDLGLPFGLVLLVVILVGRLVRPWVLRLYGKQLRPEGAPAKPEPAGSGKTPARAPMSRKQGVALVVGAIVLFALIQGASNPAPRIEGKEAEQAIAQLEELEKTGFALGRSLLTRQFQVKNSPDADPEAVEAVKQRSQLAFKASGAAAAWKSRLKRGAVRVKDRDKLQRQIQGIREDLDRARAGGEARDSP